MEVIISGAAGMAAVITGNIQLRYIDKEPKRVSSLGKAIAAFSGQSDVFRLRLRNVTEVDRELRHAWSTDRFFRLLDAALQDSTPSHLRERMIGLMENQLADDSLRQVVSRRMYAAPFPKQGEEYLNVKADTSSILLEVLRDALRDRETIEYVRNSYFSIPDTFFDSEDARRYIWSDLVNSGVVRGWVLGKLNSTDQKLLYAKLAQHLSGKTSAQAALKLAMAVVPRADRISDASQIVYENDDADWVQQRTLGESYAAFTNAISQQTAIIDKIRIHQFDTARRFAEEMITQQIDHSGAERVGKSLCRIAQAAKLAGAPELQRDWSKRATEVSPGDAQTWGHYADALIGCGRYTDAEPVIERVEELGDNLFADTQRARILRARGHALEARELYLKAARANDNVAGVQHTLSAAAETLRDMGRAAEALGEYEGLAERWPNDAGVRSGLASALLDLGRHDEALIMFGRAAKLDRSPVPANGRATTLKLSGRLLEARTSYEELLVQFPHDVPISCGAADVLRMLGDFDGSLMLYNKAREQSVESHIPVLGIAEVLRDQGRHQESFDFLSAQPDHIASTIGIRLALAHAAKNLGDFQSSARRFDAVMAAAPRLATAALGKADLLRRAGFFEEALPLYERVVKSGVIVHQALAGQALCLVSLKRFNDADKILPNKRPVTLSDWHVYLARAAILNGRGQTKAAIKHLSYGIKTCAFSRMVKLMRNMSASISLSQRDYKRALATATPLPGHVSNVIYIHTLLANHRSGQAKSILAVDEQAPDAAGLCAEIIQLFDATNRGIGGRRLDLIRQEQSLLLQAA